MTQICWNPKHPCSLSYSLSALQAEIVVAALDTLATMKSDLRKCTALLRTDFTILMYELQSMPDDEELKKEVLAVLKGVDVQEFNIKMLMNSLSKLSSWRHLLATSASDCEDKHM